MAGRKQFGGQGRSATEQIILITELANAGAPVQAHSTGELIVAQALFLHGSKEQQQEWLSAIRRGERSFALGYSEPEAGSDLAALRTRAVRDGDDWIVNGQKLWSTGGDKAEYIWLAVRTDPEAKKHLGISVLERIPNEWTISGAGEIVGTFLRGEALEQIAERVPQPADSARGELSQQRFELGEGFLDWIEIGTIGRQVDECCAAAFDRLADAGDFVTAEIVRNDDVAGRERWCEDLFDIGEEGLPVHGSVEDKRGREPAGAQAGTKVDVFQCP